MKAADKRKVRDLTELEGFDYAFCCYSDFKEIKDLKFHELRRVYLNATRALRDYIGDKDYFVMKP